MEIKTADLIQKIDEKLLAMKKGYENRPRPEPGMKYKITDWDRTGQFLTGDNCVNSYNLINEKKSNLNSRARNYVMTLTTQCIFEMLSVNDVRTIQHTTDPNTNS